MASDQGNANLSAGRQAVTYVKSKLKLGAANNPFKLQSSVVGQLRAMDAILKVWRAEDDAMESNFVNPADGLRMAQAFADSAERYGAGNCGEHSAVAYMWLRRNGVYPVDWVHFKNKDHAFVPIGRSKRGITPPSRFPSSLGSTTLWCAMHTGAAATSGASRSPITTRRILSRFIIRKHKTNCNSGSTSRIR